MPVIEFDIPAGKMQAFEASARDAGFEGTRQEVVRAWILSLVKEAHRESRGMKAHRDSDAVIQQARTQAEVDTADLT